MRKLSRTGVVAVTALALTSVGIAFAAWTATGSGDGSAVADTAQALEVTSAEVTGLFPTGDVDFTVNVENLNPYAVDLDDLTVGTITVDTEHSGCTVSAVTAEDLDLTAGGEGYVGPNSNADFPMNVEVSNAADDACQGATFTIPVTANGESAETVTAGNTSAEKTSQFTT
jgi:hypothetical protein